MSKYLFNNKFTNHFIISTNQDTDGFVVKTVSSIKSVPKDSFLFVDPAISGNTTKATIKGVNNLYISLEGSIENTPLTWSRQPFTWVINTNAQGASFIKPASGADLFWVNIFGNGPIVIVRVGRRIELNENQWIIKEI